MEPLVDVLAIKRRKLELPWETGLLSEVLGSSGSRSSFGVFGSNSAFLDPSWNSNFVRTVLDEEFKAVRDSPDSSSSQEQSADDEVQAGGSNDDAAWRSIARVRNPKAWNIEAESKRLLAVERWRVIVLQNPKASKTGRQLLLIMNDEGYEAKAQGIIRDTFFKKSTATLHSRAGATLMYGKWLFEFHSLHVWPWSESKVYDYLVFLREHKAPASRGQRLLEAIGFSHGVFGADGAVSVLESSRCEGAAMECLKTKQPLLQCDPLTPRQLCALEIGTALLLNPVDRVLSGSFAFLTNARARFSDVALLVSEPTLDITDSGHGYVEAVAAETKTSNRKERRLRMLPIVASATGLSGFRWAEVWLKERAKLKLAVNRGPLMTAVGLDGAFTCGRLRSGEATLALRRILHLMGTPLLEGQRLGTHAMKTTLLSYAAKGELPLSDRKLLGYHANGTEEMALLYSRDSMAGPIRKLESLLQKIRNGVFMPHVTRSGRWDAGSPDPILCRSFKLNKDDRVVVDPDREMWKQAGLAMHFRDDGDSSTGTSVGAEVEAGSFSQEVTEMADMLLASTQVSLNAEKCIVRVSCCNQWMVTALVQYAETRPFGNLHATMAESVFSEAVAYFRFRQEDLVSLGWDEDGFKLALGEAVKKRLRVRESLALEGSLLKEVALASEEIVPWARGRALSSNACMPDSSSRELAACVGCRSVTFQSKVTECSRCLLYGCEVCLPVVESNSEFPGFLCLFCAHLPKEQVEISFGQGPGARKVHCRKCSRITSVDLTKHICEGCLCSGCPSCLELTPVDGNLLCSRCAQGLKDGAAGWAKSAVEVDDSSESSEESATEEETEDDVEQEAAEALARSLNRRPARRLALGLCIHWKSRIMHRMNVAEKKLACGRQFDDCYREIDEPEFCYPKCRTCFGVHAERAVAH